ncbi:MAG: DUF3253 domain-containing protein [Hyphomonadaceae bacterium]|nr:DUF3253 domain-containing protein [Hyphomonadaceae bacterium]
MTPPAIEKRPQTPDEAILALTASRGPDKSVCPSEAARLYAGEERWRSVLGEVRKAAVRLALAGRIVITRKGKPVDPTAFRGVYRLRAAEAVGEGGSC